MIGSTFCPNVEEAIVMADIFYADLSYQILTETYAYPMEEMINELVGIMSLYFGFSFVSLAILVRSTWRATKTTVIKVRSLSTVTNEMDEFKNQYFNYFLGELII